jgi:hypothetical protein
MLIDSHIVMELSRIYLQSHTLHFNLHFNLHFSQAKDGYGTRFLRTNFTRPLDARRR